MSEDSKRKAPDWERIEADYRAGLLSLREIGAKDGNVTEGAIRKRAKKLGWTRDLAARIQAKAEELVRREVVRTDGTQLATANPAAERLIIEANAEVIAGVRLRQRKDIARGLKINMALLEKLEAMIGDPLILQKLEELLDRVNGDDSEDVAKAITKSRETFAKAVSIHTQAATLKTLADSMKSFVTMENEAWGLSADTARDPETPSAPITPEDSEAAYARMRG